VTLNGDPIQDLPLRTRVSTGIEVSAELAGTVGEYEQRETARFLGMPFPAWLKQDPDERARSIAYRRANLMIEAHSNEAVSRHAEAEAKRGQRS
jgi:predicted metal-dependent phosphoesterase TrpH